MTLFVFLEMTLMAFYLGYTQKKSSWYYAAYTAAAIGTLVKGPIGLGLPGLIILFFPLVAAGHKSLGAHETGFRRASHLILTGLWYGPMTVLHGHDFLLNFFGVHNFLRATVSEHPRQNVWYYYFFVFLFWAGPLGLYPAPFRIKGGSGPLKSGISAGMQPIRKSSPKWMFGRLFLPPGLL